MAELIWFDGKSPFEQQGSTRDLSVIQADLAGSGLLVECFDVQAEAVDTELPSDADTLLINANQHLVAQLQARYHCHFVDAVFRNSYTENKRFLYEHRHNEGEIRLVAYGSAWFYFPIADRIYGLRCDGGDFVYLPAKMPHWFDAGESPNYAVIRFFSEQGGWQATYTERDIAQAFFAVHG